MLVRRVHTAGRRVRDFLSDLSGTAALEFALCFPILVILFYQYMGISANMRLVESLERATACMATVLANTAQVPTGEGDAYRYTLMGGGISDDSIRNAFLAMMGNTAIQGSLRITYSSGPGASEVPARIIHFNGGNLFSQESPAARALSEYRSDVQAVSSESYSYPRKLIRVEASIKNTTKESAWLLAASFFPSQYHNAFIAVRSK